VTAIRPVVVIMGATKERPPPGIDAIADLVELRFAPDRPSLEESIEEAEIVYTWRGEPADLEVVWPLARRLRWVQGMSVGVDRLLFPALVESDVPLTNARGAADQAIAGSVLGFIVAMAMDLRRMLDDQRAHVWGQRETERLAGARLVVVGPGPIGRAIARASRDGLGMRPEAVGRAARPGDDVFERVRGIDELHAALGEADYVVDALPLTGKTRHVFDAEAFAAMKPTARFVNIGRGATVDEPALVEALRAGRIAGAALDVFEEEPLPDSSPLWDMANVIVCPHMSGIAHGWEEDFTGVFYDNVRRWLRGEPLWGIVDKRLGFPA